MRIRKNISIQSLKNNFRNIKIDNKKYSVLNKKFDLNLSLQQYSKLFDDFLKTLNKVKLTKLKLLKLTLKKEKLMQLSFLEIDENE